MLGLHSKRIVATGAGQAIGLTQRRAQRLALATLMETGRGGLDDMGFDVHDVIQALRSREFRHLPANHPGRALPTIGTSKGAAGRIRRSFGGDQPPSALDRSAW